MLCCIPLLPLIVQLKQLCYRNDFDGVEMGFSNHPHEAAPLSHDLQHLKSSKAAALQLSENNLKK